MSVYKIKNDLSVLCNTISTTITECEKCKNTVSNLGVISENDLNRIISADENCSHSVSRFKEIIQTVNNECSRELDVYFKDFNTMTNTGVQQANEIISKLNEHIEVAKSCFEFIQISPEYEWLVLCGVTADIFTFINPILQSFKMYIQNIQVQANANNNKLILKGR